MLFGEFFAAAIVAGILGNYLNRPLFSWAADDAQLSDRKRFPTFSRTVGSSDSYVPPLLTVLLVTD